MSEPIIILKAKDYKKPAYLDLARKKFAEQMAEGLILLPHDFEYVVINPNELEGQIIVQDINCEPNKKRSLIDKLLGRY